MTSRRSPRTPKPAPREVAGVVAPPNTSGPKPIHPPSVNLPNVPLGEVPAVVEALLLASDSPLNMATIERLLPEAGPEVIARALDLLRVQYSGPQRGIHLMEVAGGWQFRTNPTYANFVQALFETKPARVSRAALETLAIVAYRQPLTRAQVEEIRGVDCSGVLRTLVEHGLIQVLGQLDDIGRPNIYGTTDRFLEYFGLQSLEQLPTLDDGELASIQALKEELRAEQLDIAELLEEPEG